MKKIVSLFMRNYDGNGLVRNEIVKGAEWVIQGEGIATRKWDGTACMVREGKLYKRYDAKRGKQPPANFEQCQEPDSVTGHWPGWLPTGEGPEDKYFREAFDSALADGTYELCGPKINGNLEELTEHTLIRHGMDILEDCPRNYDALKYYLSTRDIEGVVWHHMDGRMAKIKKKDFGLKRKLPLD